MPRAPKKNRELDPEIDYAVRMSRVAGLSERAIYEQLRDTLGVPIPSYRDVRASLAKAGLRYKAEAARARRNGEYPKDISEKSRPIQKTRYIERLATTKKRSQRPESIDELNRAYIIGFLARGGIEPDKLASKELTDSFFNIYDGLRS